MANTTLLVFLVADFLFLAGGAALLAVSLIFQAGPANGPISNAASGVLLEMAPLTGGIVNAIFVFVAFGVSIPGILMKDNKGWLRLHCYLVVICALITLALGLVIWFSTLQTRSNLSSTWGLLPTSVQSLLQQEFQCCGYFNPVSPQFIPDNTCTSTQVAAQLGGCVTQFSSFANTFLDIVFTAMFGIAGIDIIAFLAAVVVIKDRDQKKRYRLIDEKYGIAAL